MATNEEIMAAMSERGPEDYNLWDDERKLLISIIRKQVEKNGGGDYDEGGASLLKWILGILSTLTVAVIVGGITVYGRFTSLETKVSEWQFSTQRQIDAAYQRLDRLENRRP